MTKEKYKITTIFKTPDGQEFSKEKDAEDRLKALQIEDFFKTMLEGFRNRQNSDLCMETLFIENLDKIGEFYVKINHLLSFDE
jgi:hypothetical protein